MLFNWSFQYLCWLYISSVWFEHKTKLVWRISQKGNQLVLLKNHWLRTPGLVVNKVPENLVHNCVTGYGLHFHKFDKI